MCLFSNGNKKPLDSHRLPGSSVLLLLNLSGMCQMTFWLGGYLQNGGQHFWRVFYQWNDLMMTSVINILFVLMSIYRFLSCVVVAI
jgi:hypothetical protein